MWYWVVLKVVLGGIECGIGWYWVALGGIGWSLLIVGNRKTVLGRSDVFEHVQCSKTWL